MLRRFLIAASAVLAWGEFVHWRASRKCLGKGGAVKASEADDGGTDASGAGVGKAVVVLGFANRRARANFVNRYRVCAGLRSLESDGLRVAGSQRVSALDTAHLSAALDASNVCAASVGAHAPAASVGAHAPAAACVLVLCGGAVSGPVPEADVMESYARTRGYAGTIRLDRKSRSTLQNIENAIPLIEDADSIAIVSNSVHALKGRILLRELRPDLADRLVRGQDYRFGEQILIKPIAAVAGLADLRALRRRRLR